VPRSSAARRFPVGHVYAGGVAGVERVPLSAFDRDGRAVVALEGRDVAVFLVDGRAYAFANACPHEGNPLVLGDVAGSTLTCPFHNWRFDLETGACIAGDAPAERYDAELRGDEVWVTAP
jgi:nitrite reductase (NADH) small subunit